jgi:hypothetical protein
MSSADEKIVKLQALTVRRDSIAGVSFRTPASAANSCRGL